MFRRLILIRINALDDIDNNNIYLNLYIYIYIIYVYINNCVKFMSTSSKFNSANEIYDDTSSKGSSKFFEHRLKSQERWKMGWVRVKPYCRNRVMTDMTNI